LDLFRLTFLALKLMSTVALCSIAGYMVVGGIVGMIGLALKADVVVKYAPPVGWLLGAIVGLANEIPRMSKSPSKSHALKTDNGKEASRATPKLSLGPKLGWPTLTDFGKSLGVCSLFGILAGLISSLFLSLLLISATTSPFVPDSWRPGTQSLVDPEEHLWHKQRRRRRDGIGTSTSFTHPLLGPIFLTATGSCVALGILAGVVTAFFPDKEDSSTLHETTTPS